MDAKNILVVLTTIIGFGCIVYFATNETDSMKDKIKENPKVVICTITKTEKAGYKGGYLRLFIEFTWKNQVIKTDFASPKTECTVICKQLLLIVDSNNEENSQLLLKPEDFSEFDLVFPDSLSWTKECFKL
ncbi:MAG: hypothetical protein ACOVSR_05140 [Bacteroidia bacterium]